MIDGFGRKIDYIRISVTDRCNLRCAYCMPGHGVEPVAHGDVLTYDEIERLTGVLAGLGVSKIKITGGEPLVRRGLPELLKVIKGVPGVENLTLTTNGVLFEEQGEALLEAGLDGVNISLDSLKAERYARITGGTEQDYYRVLRAIDKAMDMGLRTRINCVALRDVNHDEITDLAGLSYAMPVDVRFIEIMPMGLGRSFTGYFQDEILAKLSENFGNYTEIREIRGNGPAKYYDFDGLKGKIGIISPISHKFCGNCNKIRLSATGMLMTCLDGGETLDLRELLRNGAADGEIAGAVLKAVALKPACHSFCEDAQGECSERESMSKIGG